MELPRRSILFKGRILGELAYLGYASEQERTVVRFLLFEAYGVHLRPLSDVVGEGKMFEIETVVNEKSNSFNRIFILKYYLSDKDATYTRAEPGAISHPAAFLSSVARKVQQEMARKWGSAPIEDPAF